MPKRIADDDEMPRRRRSARAVAIEAEHERGPVMRVLLHSPKDTAAALLAAVAVCAIMVNALFLQAGRHPSPMFGTVVTLSAPHHTAASPLPRPRPAELAARPVEAGPSVTRSVEARGTAPGNADHRNADPMTDLVVKSTGTAVTAHTPRPPAPVPAVQSATARRVVAVQRALTQYGYGQLEPDGIIGSDTQAAISKFEHARKMPVTGHLSDRLVRELTVMIGHPID